MTYLLVHIRRAARRLRGTIVLATLIATGTTGAMAQGAITTLDWNQMRIDSLLPRYSEVVPLARDYAKYDFSVHVEYPSWSRLTPAEELAARPHLDEICDSLCLHTYVGASRGQGSLDIDFIPIIYNEKEDALYKLMQCKLAIIATPKANAPRRAASRQERWASQSVLSSGRWVKIAVEQDGIYAITRDMIAKMGFHDINRVKVYGYGGHLLPETMNADNAFDDLEEIPLVRNARSGALLFWANGTQSWNWDMPATTANQKKQHHFTNNYSTVGCYFITEGDAPAQLLPEEQPATASRTLVSFTHYWVRDIDEHAWFSGGRSLWENKQLGVSGGRTYQIPTPGYAGGTAALRIAIANASGKTSSFKFTLNDSTLTSMSVSAPAAYSYATASTNYYNIRGLRKGNNTLTVRTDCDNSMLDYIELTYQHDFRMNGSTLPFSLFESGNARFKIEARPGQDLLLIRRSQPNRPATLLTADSDGYYNVSGVKGDYVALDLNDVTYPSPIVIGEVANQNLHADQAVNMVIITPSSGIHDTQATRLANAHAQYDGVTCRVVRAEQIYNEFSSGTPDATAYRRYMKMLYDRALQSGQEPPRYLLLFGDAAWDNRMLTPAWANFTPNDFLLCFESENSESDTKCYVMEDYFALLDDGEGARLTSDKFDIGVGRFPARTTDEGRILVDKTIMHMQDNDPGKWQNLALFLGDDGDDNSHMIYADQTADTILTYSPDIDARKIMWDSYQRVSTTTGNTFPLLTQYLTKSLNEGVMMMNYVGHGSTFLLSHENVFTLGNVRQMRNTRQGFWFTAACDIMPFDGLADNIGEAAMLLPYGGTVGFIGTTRTVYANLNYNLNSEFCKFIFARDPATGRRYSIGDALRLAKNRLNEGTTTVNKLHYALLGDPSLVFGQPLNDVVIDSINGQPLNGAPIQVKAGSRCRMAGHIADADGQAIKGVNGTLEARIMDTKESVLCPNQAKVGAGAFRYDMHRRVIFEGDVPFTDGQFELSFVVPVDINYGNTNGRAIFYATGTTADGQRITANGSTEHYNVGGISDELASDNQGPHIDVWLESERFMNGAHVSTAPMMYATIDDESGMNLSAVGIGHGIEVCIDDRADWTFDVSQSFRFDEGSTRRGSLSYQLPVLSRGTHNLRLRAWDVLNNTSTQDITFNVSGTDETAPVSAFISAGDNGSATITVVNRLTGAACGATIHLFDATGRLCYTGSIPYMAAGATSHITLHSTSLQSGIYFLQVTMEQDGRTYQSAIDKVTLKF